MKLRDVRFATRITLVLSLLIASVLIAQATVTLRNANAERRAALRTLAELTTEMQASALAGPLWDYDRERAQSGIEGMARDPDVTHVLVTDDAGEPFAEISTAVAATETVVVERGIFFVPAQGERRKVGTIRVGMSTERIEKAFQRDLARSAATVLVVLALLTAGLSLAIRSITRPLVRMTELMRRRSDGDYRDEVPDAYLKRRDEIGDIAASLEQDQRNRRDEQRLLEATQGIASELDLDLLLRDIMTASSDLLGAERASLFLFDPRRQLLWSRVAEGIDETITLEPGEGIAGSVFTSGEAEIIDAPYDDPRFSRQVDARTEFVTRNLVCLPIQDKEGRTIGVTQVLNKKVGSFDERDVQRLRSLTAQAAAAIENAQLFESVLSMRNYNESILRSLSNGVISLDADLEVQKVNAAALRILDMDGSRAEGRSLGRLLPRDSSWFLDTLTEVRDSGAERQVMDRTLEASGGKKAINLTAAPLRDLADRSAGYLLVLEDISQERRIRGAMSRYMPGRVVDQLLELGEDALGGVSQRATIMFSDIRGFTTISEEIGARATVAMLNEYLGGMVDLIDEHDGILDKFIGDAVMAVFGAPFPSDQDATNAVRTAWAMFDAVDALNERRRARGDPAIHIGLGLNTGDVVVGNIGSQRRMDYTVIGDAVNLAARLEGATKQYGARFLISEFTYHELDGDQRRRFRPADLLRVKGRHRPVAIYEGLPADAPLLAHRSEWEAAIGAYRDRQWDLARGLLARLQVPDDRLAELYLERIRAFEREPPPDDWDGVFTMESK